MAFGKTENTHVGSPVGESSKPAPKQRVRTNWIRGTVMALAVAVVNVVYFAWTGESLSSPRYGALTRHGHEPNPGGALMLTVGMLLFALFCSVCTAGKFGRSEKLRSYLNQVIVLRSLAQDNKLAVD